jgi:hypothetical protein
MMRTILRMAGRDFAVLDEHGKVCCESSTPELLCTACREAYDAEKKGSAPVRALRTTTHAGPCDCGQCVAARARKPLTVPVIVDMNAKIREAAGKPTETFEERFNRLRATETLGRAAAMPPPSEPSDCCPSPTIEDQHARIRELARRERARASARAGQ